MIWVKAEDRVESLGLVQATSQAVSLLGTLDQDPEHLRQGLYELLYALLTEPMVPDAVVSVIKRYVAGGGCPECEVEVGELGADHSQWCEFMETKDW